MKTAFLLRRGIISLVIRGVNILLLFFISIIAAKYMGVKEFGAYTYALSFAMIFSIPIKAGLPILVLRETAKSHALNNIERIKGVLYYSNLIITIFSLLCFIFAFVIINLNSNTERKDIEPYLLATALMVAVIISYNAISTSVLQGFKRVITAQLPELLISPMLLLVLIYGLGIYGKLDSNSMMISHAGATIAALIFSWTCLKGVMHKTKSVKTFIDRSWKFSLIPLSILSGFQIVNAQAGVFLLGAMVNPEQAGILKIALQFSSVMSLPVTVVSYLISPYIAAQHAEKNKAKLQKMLTISTRISFFVSIFIASALIFFANYIINRFLGEDYTKASDSIFLLCIANVIFASFGSVLSLANMSGLEKYSIISSGVGLILNIGLCVYLIPLYGVIGASIATAVSMISWKAMLSIVIYKKTNLISILK